MSDIKRGSTPCPACDTRYQNNAVPPICITGNCRYELGGKFNKKNKPVDARLVTENIASVRQNTQGVSKRVFVPLDTLRCSETECISKLNTISEEAKGAFRCRHALLALKATERAIKTTLDVSNLGELSEDQRRIVQKTSQNGKLGLFSLPGDNICVPVLDENAEDSSSSFIHVMNGKCPEKKCQAGGSRVHSLTQKSHHFCLHTYLILKAGLPLGKIKKEAKTVKHEMDRKMTVELVIDLVMEHLPTATADHNTFLKVNKNFLDQLYKKKDISAELAKHSNKQCPKCSGVLVNWTHMTKDSFLVALGDIKRVQIRVKQCKKCNVLLYPELYNVGVIPLHNKFLISYDYILELLYLLDSGISMIEVIKSKLHLLCQREGLDFHADNNHASMIERLSVAINALLITGEDLNSVVCLTCGMAPKMILSDGNSKDTIAVTGNMIYDFKKDDGDIPVPSLEDYKKRLASQLLRSAFFQDEAKEDFDMLRVPVIMAPKLLKKQVNNDKRKETLFNKPNNYGPETLAGLATLIARKEINITSLDTMSPILVKKVSKEIKLKKISKKSTTALTEEIKAVARMYVAGQGPCHAYVRQRGRTGGWMDAWCPHDTKIGAKLETMQESVSDISDIIHCLNWMPKLHVHDDPCHLVSHTEIHYEEEFELSLGTERRGCFETPSDTTEPTTDIVCFDIVPIESPYNVTNYEHQDNQLLHPDSTNCDRYVMGTRFQTRGKGGKNAHKLPTCKFHDLDKCRQGAEIKTMSQESLQNIRKHRTIQTDKLRSFECSYLANYIIDFLRNQRLYKEKLKLLTSDLSVIVRDELWRGRTINSDDLERPDN